MSLLCVFIVRVHCARSWLTEAQRVWADEREALNCSYPWANSIMAEITQVPRFLILISGIRSRLRLRLLHDAFNDTGASLLKIGACFGWVLMMKTHVGSIRHLLFAWCGERRATRWNWENPGANQREIPSLPLWCTGSETFDINCIFYWVRLN